MMRIIAVNEPVGLLHVNNFFKETVYKRRLDVHLVQHEIVRTGDAQNDSN